MFGNFGGIFFVLNLILNFENGYGKEEKNCILPVFVHKKVGILETFSKSDCDCKIKWELCMIVSRVSAYLVSRDFYSLTTRFVA